MKNKLVIILMAFGLFSSECCFSKTVEKKAFNNKKKPQKTPLIKKQSTMRKDAFGPNPCLMIADGKTAVKPNLMIADGKTAVKPNLMISAGKTKFSNYFKALQHEKDLFIQSGQRLLTSKNGIKETSKSVKAINPNYAISEAFNKGQALKLVSLGNVNQSIASCASVSPMAIANKNIANSFKKQITPLIEVQSNLIQKVSSVPTGSFNVSNIAQNVRKYPKTMYGFGAAIVSGGAYAGYERYKNNVDQAQKAAEQEAQKAIEDAKYTNRLKSFGNSASSFVSTNASKFYNLDTLGEHTGKVATGALVLGTIGASYAGYQYVQALKAAKLEAAKLEAKKEAELNAAKEDAAKKAALRFNKNRSPLRRVR